MTHYHSGQDGTAILCDCCERELLAEIRTREALVVKDGRHGQKHVAVVSAKEVVTRLAGTTGSAGVRAFVDSLMRP